MATSPRCFKRPTCKATWTTMHKCTRAKAALQFFSTAYTQNLYLSHNFWKLTLKQQNHTLNLQNHTIIIWLWLSFQFHKTLFAKHKTQFYVTQNLTGINIMTKVFAMFAFEMCLWYFECSASFCKRCEAFCILCVQFLDLCVKFWKKEASFENVCKQLKTNCKRKRWSHQTLI